MKILAITDIHKDYDAARAAWMVEMPDLIFDCGDHYQIINLFENCPHYYIKGNHEPSMISYSNTDFPLPNYIPNGVVIEFDDGLNTIKFLGIDGNYGTQQGFLQVNPRILNTLHELPPHSVDIILVHESPLNVAKGSKEHGFSLQVLAEIDRLHPKLVISGHTNRPSEILYGKNQVKFVNLPDMSCGYNVINVEDDVIKWEKKVACFGTNY